MMRPSFILGGGGTGIADDETELLRGGQEGSRHITGERDPGRGVGARLEGIRARGDARPCRQRGHRLLYRELRPDGSPHGRLDNRRSDPDPLRPGVPGDAGRRDQGSRGDWCRDRRLQRAVRRGSGDGSPPRHRDEPAGQPLLRPGFQGHRVPDRQDRRAPRGRVHPRRDRQRHHQGDACVVRAGSRLHGCEDPTFRLRQVPVGADHPGHVHAQCRRGHGHRPHLPRGAPEGLAQPGERASRAQRRPGRVRHVP